MPIAKTTNINKKRKRHSSKKESTFEEPFYDSYSNSHVVISSRFDEKQLSIEDKIAISKKLEKEYGLIILLYSYNINSCDIFSFDNDK